MFDVIGVGHACYDNLCTVPVYPREDTASRIVAWDEQGGGAASQALVTLARLGASTAYAGNLGDDRAGQFLLADYQKEKVNTECVKVIKGAVSSTSFILISQETGQRTIFYYPGKLPVLDIEKATEAFIGQSSYLHLDAVDYDSALKAAETARRHHVKTSLDGCEVRDDVSQTIRLITLTDVLITNQTYPEKVTGCSCLPDALKKLAAMGPQIVITTCGADGAFCYDGSRIVHYPAYDIRPVDSTGAGDSFHGAFLFGLVNHYSIERCVQFASAVSAINCMTLGGRAGLPTLDEVFRYMESHPYGRSKVIAC
ncbi:MAG: carbohydrate kinase family protein [Clostridia bacterium]|nr:carbohydrate kinase family protein [Clostridia bacterium]